ncbi:YicC/YloC family endoribonuclease [Desulfurobacterium atlanticum]|nr:YicC/YloC family endoribonuclease [Desulfurobacterium atlanticum]
MTGYGKGEATNNLINVTVEIKTINSKALDVRINLSRAINNLMSTFNEILKKYIKRGKVDVFINYKLSPDVEIPVCVNYSMAKTYINAINKISGLTGKEISITMRDLLSMHDIFMKEEIDFSKFEPVFIEAFESALKKVDEERIKEGEKLKQDIEKRLEKIEATVRKIENRSKEISKILFEKLKEKVSKLLEDFDDKEELTKRVELEVALLAEKQDVSEEITRLYSHIKRFRELLNEDFSGKTMDFLCQEMHREINTLGSKLKEINITEPILQIKTEIARIKEQVQNVE